MKVSWKFYLEKMNRKISRKLLFIALVSQINHDSYCTCSVRNMPPFYSYEKLTQIFSVTILLKRGSSLYVSAV